MTTAQLTDIFRIGGDLPVHRLGYGAMQLPGPGVWGEPADRDGALRVVCAAVEQGVDFIDTADSYGPAGERADHRRGAAPVPRGPGHRDEGGPDPHRARHLDAVSAAPPT